MEKMFLFHSLYSFKYTVRILFFKCFFTKITLHVNGFTQGSHDSISVYWLGWKSGVWILAKARFFLFCPGNNQTRSGVHTASSSVGTGDFFLEGKWAGHEVDHSAPSSAKVKNEVELYLHSSYMPSWKPKDNFTSMGLYSQVHCTG